MKHPSWEEVSRLNRKLVETYGSEGLKPRFQIVWSGEAEEVRRGEFNVFSPSGLIFLRTEVGIHKRLKYGHVRDRWILEGLIFDPQPEYPDSSHGHHEPLWVFDGNGEYRKPEWDYVEYIVKRVLDLRTKKVHRTESDDWEDDKKAYIKEVDQFETELDTTSVIGTQLHHGDGVSFANLDGRPSK